MLTDGQVSNAAEVVGLVLHHRANARVFALGLGHGASHELVEGIGFYIAFLRSLIINHILCCFPASAYQIEF